MDSSNPDLVTDSECGINPTDQSYTCYPRSCYLYRRKGLSTDTILVFEIADIDSKMNSKIVVVNV